MIRDYRALVQYICGRGGACVLLPGPFSTTRGLRFMVRPAEGHFTIWPSYGVNSGPET